MWDVVFPIGGWVCFLIDRGLRLSQFQPFVTGSSVDTWSPPSSWDTFKSSDNVVASKILNSSDPVRSGRKNFNFLLTVYSPRIFINDLLTRLLVVYLFKGHVSLPPNSLSQRVSFRLQTTPVSGPLPDLHAGPSSDTKYTKCTIRKSVGGCLPPPVCLLFVPDQT